MKKPLKMDNNYTTINMVTEFPNAKWNEDTIFKPLEYEENEAVSLFDI